MFTFVASYPSCLYHPHGLFPPVSSWYFAARVSPPIHIPRCQVIFPDSTLLFYLILPHISIDFHWFLSFSVVLFPRFHGFSGNGFSAGPRSWAASWRPWTRWPGQTSAWIRSSERREPWTARLGRWLSMNSNHTYGYFWILIVYYLCIIWHIKHII